MKPFALLTTLLLLLTGCTGLPKGIEPVTGFDQDRYLGTWYEIARLDHSFERSLSQVTADYTLNDDGSIKVINRGYNAEKGEWKEAQGRAKFVGDSEVGHLKVSFFGPFYASYVVFELDDDYSTA
ncbi:lipocalin family protein [Marinobacter sp. LQ44]|uniref:lipocalin family protein n=1 Tax=unclassified Marinobacter TaxID=83889 RepID=UPI0009EF0DB3|nr:lipocalin family protein [Marinobacter sp. LQ44]